MKLIILCILVALIIQPVTIHARHRCISCCVQKPAKKARQHSPGRRSYSTHVTPPYTQARKATNRQSATPVTSETDNRSLEKLIKQIRNKESHEQLLKTAQEVRSSRRETIRATAAAPLDAQYKNADLMTQPSSCPTTSCITKKKIRPYRVRCFSAPCKPFCRRYGQV